ncbi:uncharacterized protein LOC131216404 [Anopheles bellator]|uniref:uncharacterized protein LOC131216404 n=1 Tax=Anopheles bellator TaxID=139047 RepID=UPI0026489DA2|nr:uncharacterized protein LOC131216404 [Anopheles bellator]
MATLLSSVKRAPVLCDSSSVWLLTWLNNYQRKSTKINAIDSFIIELIENKTLKWKVLNSRHRDGQPKVAESSISERPLSQERNNMGSIQRTSFKIAKFYNEITQNPLALNISSMDVAQVDHLISTALAEHEHEDVNLLLEQLIQFKKLPSQTTMNKLLKYVASNGEMDKLERLTVLAVDQGAVDSVRITPIQRFEHYRALCQWKMGNTVKSLETYRHIVEKCDIDEMPVIDRILVEIIDETIDKKSEAALLSVMRLCEFCLTEHRHEFPICSLWDKSFHSIWHSDQELSKTLFDRHFAIRAVTSKRVGHLCYSLLLDNNVEKVYQLMEMFLKHDMKPECASILVRLFDYQYWRKNLRGCSEIMQNAVDLNIMLPELYNRRLLELLLGRPSVNSTLSSTPKKTVVLKPRKYELKF